MRKLTLAILLTVFFSASVSAQSPLLLYDGFDYTAGELLAPTNDTTADPHPGQHNVEYNVDWRYTAPGTANTNPPGIVAGTLSSASLPASTGNSVKFDHSQLAVSRIEIPNSATSGPLYYWSALFRINTLGTLRSITQAAASNGVTLGSFNNSIGPQATVPSALASTLLIRPDFEVDPLIPNPNTYQIGTGSTSNNGDKQFASSAPLHVGDTVFIVASYTVVSGANNDEARMWINPAPSSLGAAEDAKPTPELEIAGGNSGNDLSGTVRSFHLRNNNAIYQDTDWQFDELRVGTTWASVTSSAAPPSLSGDYNDDNKVDGDDFAIWSGMFGDLGAGLDADDDLDGDVDGNDFLAWQANFGAGVVEGGIAAVPEPAASSLAIVFLGAVAFGADECRRRRKR